MSTCGIFWAPIWSLIKAAGESKKYNTPKTRWRSASTRIGDLWKVPKRKEMFALIFNQRPHRISIGYPEETRTWIFQSARTRYFCWNKLKANRRAGTSPNPVNPFPECFPFWWKGQDDVALMFLLFLLIWGAKDFWIIWKMELGYKGLPFLQLLLSSDSDKWLYTLI